jgi:hypothetical protein
MESIFMNKSDRPTEQDLVDKLGSTYLLWSDLKSYLNDTLKNPSGEWNYPGKKYGWSFRMKSKKRNIIYFLPRDGYFKVAFVFGQKATNKVMESSVNEIIKAELNEAKVYAEGRGIRIDIKDDQILNDIKNLIQIKVEN